MKSLVLGLLVATAACGARSAAPKRTFPDAPLELRDDTDRDQAIDQLWVLPHGAARDHVRTGIADAIARRISDALEEDKPFDAEQLVFQLASLWQDDPEAAGKGLADHEPLLEKLRATFAKSGAIEPTIACLALLAEIDGSHRDQRLGELDEILRFADDMAAAENGADAQRAQPINLLQPTVLVLPLPWLVD